MSPERDVGEIAEDDVQRQLRELESAGIDELRSLVISLRQENRQLQSKLRQSEAAQRRGRPHLRNDLPCPAPEPSAHGSSLVASSATRELQPILPAQAKPPAGVPRSTSSFRRQRPLNLVVKVRPGAVVVDQGWVDTVAVQSLADDCPAELRQKLVGAGLSWSDASAVDGVDVAGARLLFRGVALKADVSLWEQGVRDGSELQLLRPLANGSTLKLRPPLMHAPRGLLMNPGTRPWQAGVALAAEKNVSEWARTDAAGELEHMAELACAKVGMSKPRYGGCPAPPRLPDGTS